MSDYQNLGEYLASLQKCGWCGKIVSGETCRDETDEPCPPEQEFWQEQYEEEVRKEFYMQQQWREYEEELRRNGEID